jgi:stearoyl-CoA desaturase (delta-9 desaturase)
VTTENGVECHVPLVSFLSVSYDPPAATRRARKLSEYQWFGAIPFILVHLLPLAAFLTGTKWQDWAVCVALYWIRMFGVTGAYHRYFSHRTYKTSRFFQLVLALLAMSSSQKGVLWWAARHRTHHKLSDQDGDPHDSRRGFWYSHLGWLYDHSESTDYGKVRDLARYPELVFLNKLWFVPPALLGLAVFLALGWSGLLELLLRVGDVE